MENNKEEKSENNNIIDENNIRVDDEFLKSINEYDIPPYILYHYKWLYLSRLVNFFNKNWVNNIRLFGKQKLLIKEYLKEIPQNTTMMHIGNNYGALLGNIINKIGSYGNLDIIDVLPNQLLIAKNNTQNKANVECWLQSADTVLHRQYDVVGMFFLLSDVPLNYKEKIMNNLLQLVEHSNTKIVIIDYHHPNFYHPAYNILRFFNIFFKPYVEYLWDNEIETLIKKPEKYNIHKTTYFGNLYQKITISKKSNAMDI